MRKTRFFTALAITSLLFTSCYQLFQDNIVYSPDPSTVHTTLNDLVNSKPEITELAAPRQIFVSQDLYQDRVEISWAQVEGATSYRLERWIDTEGTGPTDDSEFTIIPANKYNVFSSAFVYGPNYTDIILQTPVYNSEEYNWRYYYRVYAQNDDIAWSNNQPLQSDSDKPGSLFKVPSAIVASAGDYMNKITLEWDKVPSVAEYIIYRSYDENALSALEIARVKASESTYSDPVAEENQGKLTYYKIVAKNNDDKLSVQSPIIMGYTTVKGAPQAVKNVKLVDGSGRGQATNEIKIQWDSAGDETKYLLYRSSSSDKSLSLIADLPAGTTTYEDKKKLRKNTFYYYQVLAYNLARDADGNIIPGETLKGPMSKSGPEAQTPCEGFILSAPAQVDVVNNGGSHKIRFQLPIGAKGSSVEGKVLSENDYSYRILGSDTMDGTFEDLVPESSEINGSLFEAVISVPKKFYQVKTKFGDLESDASDISMPSPNAAREVTVSKAANLEGEYGELFKANVNGVLPVKITWKAPEGGADGGYFIYRSTKPDSGFTKVNDNPLPADATSYLDVNETAKTGIYYYYSVLALNQLLKGANYSETVMGYGAITAEQYMREYNKTIKASHKRLTFMNKSNDMDKLGDETVAAEEGTLHYYARTQGIGARITMDYTDYVEFYIGGEKANGPYFKMNGASNTTAKMDASGNMDGEMKCSGMYPGAVNYNSILIKGGGAGGGTYKISRDGFADVDISWLIGEE